ncbi:DNA-directed RNA polymerase subunit beta [Agrococcus sp. SGAir0287]|uniref:DNA-directed RNA polymerase subunit beta n=1 Tax=Agrococcus sp. SGAir0287 TaxID=2070347 RepID=UPI0010CCD598|nr:DNA-directed RNA polymerase subunit beta [Agrococcus sp. SGAir0287]QCR19938.1 DNA-directed RNA polymerase subunit beta [Agrococcus sp. SGAir0287]
MAQHARPARYASRWFEQFVGDMDPVARVQLAHETAAALLARVRSDADADVVERILALAADDGIDAVAELWADARPHSLPGALWRIHLLATMVAQQPVAVAAHFTSGAERLETADAVVAGAAVPTGPEEIATLADEILRGVFAGDLALALDRAAAFSRIAAAGSLAEADARDAYDAEAASRLTARASRLAILAGDLAASAALQRRDALH